MKDDFREMMQSNLLKILVLLLRLASRIFEVYKATLLFSVLRQRKNSGSGIFATLNYGQLP